jgi:D-serine deaminase-like pyridoxal phosphate-dependent protein
MAAAAWFHVEREEALPSPSLLVYRDRLRHNLNETLRIAGDPARLRPHVKTHKMVEVVRRQLAMHITRFKAATIAEAEMCAEAGAADVLVAMPCVGGNAARLASLAKARPDLRLSTLADSEDTVRSLASAAQQAGVTLGVFIDIDCGMGRTGIVPGREAALVARSIHDVPALHFAGIHAYDGHLHTSDPETRRQACEEAMAPVVAFKEEFVGEGLPVEEFCAGGSPTFPFHASHADRTLSPGTTVFWDFGYADQMPDLDFLPAAVLLTRVISRPGHNRITVDLGHKAVAAENPHPRVRFLEFEGEDPPVVMQSEEHLVLEVENASRFRIGQALHGIPRHICPTVALHGEVHLIDGGVACDVWPVSARDRRLTV